MMCGARRRHKQSRVAWFFIFFFLLLLTTSQGDQELVHVKEDSHTTPMSGGGGEGGGGGGEEEELSRLGSRPPCCERKCGGCAPCTAVLQVRAAAGRLGTQGSDYEPVGWKCKCGAAVFDP